MSINAAILPGSISRLAGGLFTSVRRLSESIGQTGRVDVQVVGNSDAHTEEDLRQWQQPPVVLHGLGRRALANELFHWLQQNNPDLVHPQFLWSYASMATLRWQRPNANGRHVISPRGMLDSWAIGNSRWKKKLAAVLFESKHLKSAACIHALCESEATSIRRFGLTNPICIIPNGIDVPSDEELRILKGPRLVSSSPFTSNLPLQSDNCQIGQKDGIKVMLFLGRIHPKKGLLNLIKAWNASREFLAGWRLDIAGWDDGGYQKKLELAVEEFNLQASVKFVGQVYGQRKALMLANANAFILPSFSEGLPMAVLEAWAHGLPVMMTSHCNLPIGFETQSAVKIGTGISSLATDLAEFTHMSDSDLSQMGASGRQLAIQRFQWPLIATRLAEVYEWVLGGGEPCASIA